jgi:hypothetical protein
MRFLKSNETWIDEEKRADLQPVQDWALTVDFDRRMSARDHS